MWGSCASIKIVDFQIIPSELNTDAYSDGNIGIGIGMNEE
jgi:hypothetical protein